MSILDQGPVSRIRRNHALEHATLKVLARKNPKLSLAGSSDAGGFWIFGDIDTQELADAADEALRRLKGGEQGLAIHPNCGTNFATTGILAGAAAWLGMTGAGSDAKKRLERLPLVISLVTMILVFAQPVGPFLQARVTTDAAPGELHITGVMHHQRGGQTVHRVSTRA